MTLSACLQGPAELEPILLALMICLQRLANKYCSAETGGPSRTAWFLQGYAWEMTTAEGGWGLDGILKNKQHVLNGVVNGIDMLEWDPSADEHTAASYSMDDLSGLTPLPCV